MFLGRKCFVLLENQLHLFYESYGGLEVGIFLYPSITRTMTHCFSVIMKDQYSLGIVWEFSIFFKMLHVSWMCQQNWIKVTYQRKYNFLLHSCVRYITQSCVWYITQNVLVFYGLFSSCKRTQSSNKLKWNSSWHFNFSALLPDN